MQDNPYESPVTILDHTGNQRPDLTPAGGIRRLFYWILLALSMAGLSSMKTGDGGMDQTTVMICFWGANALIAWPRLKNIGMNPWWSLAMIIPFVNFFIIFRCLAYQENYESLSKLDGTGKLLIVAVVLGMVWITISMIYFDF
jgi:uncharacterized membrane protein YhaH (DUF805 family)